MIALFLRLILPLFAYTFVTTAIYVAVPFGPLEATGISAVIIIPALLWIYYSDQKKRGYTLAESFHLRGSFIFICLFGITLCILGNYIVELLGLTRISKAYQEAVDALYTPPLTTQILFSGFLIPAAEELIFRGMMFASLRDKLFFWLSALLSAGLFAFYHGNLPQGVYAFLIGLAAAWLYEKTKTLLAPYVLHISANLLSLFITNTRLSDSLFEGRYTVAFLAVAACIAVCCIVWINWKNKPKEDIV